MIALKFWLLIFPMLLYHQDARCSSVTFDNEVEGNVTCEGLKSCVKCDKKYADIGYRCIKCKHLIILKSRECVDTCPIGYKEEWSSLVDYMGRICKEETVIAGISLSGRKLAIVLGSLIGLAICILIILLAIVYLKYRKKKMLKDKARQSPSLSHLTGTHRSQDSEDSERPEFLKQLRYLKTDAPIFLAMLNETRRQVRELRRPSRQNSAMQAYRPVLKDLSRILILLNRGEDRIGPPPADWETLLAWGERVLRRYKKQNSHQVSQLLGFTQLPIDGYESPSLGHSPYPTQLTTFPNNYGSSNHLASASSSSSNNHLQQLAISAFDEAYATRSRNGDDDEDDMMELRTDDVMGYARRSPLLDSGVDVSSPRSMTHEFQREIESKRSNIVSDWNTGYHHRPSSYHTSMMDDDDFYTLGFRPQDEITTEL